MSNDTQSNNFVGVDVNKAHLDAHRLRDGAEQRFANDARGARERGAARPESEPGWEVESGGRVLTVLI